MKTSILIKTVHISPEMFKNENMYNSIIYFRRGHPFKWIHEKFTELLMFNSDTKVLDIIDSFEGNVYNYNIRYVDIESSENSIEEVRYGHYSNLTTDEEGYKINADRIKKGFAKNTKMCYLNPWKWIDLIFWKGEEERFLNEKRFERYYNSFTREWWLDLYYE